MDWHWGWAVLTALVLGAGLFWWTQPDTVNRVLHLQSARPPVAKHKLAHADAGPTLYRWVDLHGVVNYTTAHPPEGRHFTVVHIDSRQNIVPMDSASSH